MTDAIPFPVQTSRVRRITGAFCRWLPARIAALAPSLPDPELSLIDREEALSRIFHRSDDSSENPSSLDTATRRHARAA